jgi:hypothetical protein
MAGAVLAAALLFASAVSAHAECRLNSPGGAIKHVVYLEFDNVHFTRDNPSVPSDLEQMPNLLNFLKGKGTLAVRLLNKGASLEDVAALLGNSVAIVSKQYAPWVKSRQNRLEEAVLRTF